MPSNAPLDWDPLGPTFQNAPESVYATMREQCPLAYTERAGGFWTLFRHEDIVAVTRDASTFSNADDKLRPGVPALPIELDPPAHTRYRRLLQPYFHPARVEAMRGEIQGYVDELLEPLLRAGGGDLVPAFTNALPGRVLCMLLGFPREAWDGLKYWSDEKFAGEWQSTPQDVPRMERAERHLFGYAESLIQDNRRRGLDADRDLVNGLLVAQAEGDPVTDEEIATAVRLLLTAGHNSTTNALGNAVLHMAEHSDVQDQLRADPDQVPTAVDEFLRFLTPVAATPRVTTKDVDLHGRRVRKGEQVWLAWGAGNRDGQAFEDPDAFDPTRRPNRHLAFGHGVHKCVGLPVAKLEMDVALTTLLARTEGFELVDGVTRMGWPRRGVAALPVRLRPAA